MVATPLSVPIWNEAWVFVFSNSRDPHGFPATTSVRSAGIYGEVTEIVATPRGCQGRVDWSWPRIANSVGRASLHSGFRAR
jgi:hypothetical protein